MSELVASEYSTVKIALENSVSKFLRLFSQITVLKLLNTSCVFKVNFIGKLSLTAFYLGKYC